MIRPDERLAKVLARDPSLVDVLAQAAPGLEKLRRSGIGRIMGRVLTVERAARMAGVETEELVRRLESAPARGRNEAASPAPAGAAHEDQRAGTPAPSEGAFMGSRAEATTLPSWLAAVPPELIVDLDVRETLRAGGEPFAAIMAARAAMPVGGVLRVRAIFEPAPLYFVFGAQGLEHWTERLADDDWRVWFYAAEAAADAQPTASAVEQPAPVAAAGEPAGEGEVVVLDVRDLEPPEPMLRTLAALEKLPAGATLVQLNVRVPRFLLPHLVERGYSYEVREQDDTLVRTFIRRR